MPTLHQVSCQLRLKFRHIIEILKAQNIHIERKPETVITSKYLAILKQSADNNCKEKKKHQKAKEEKRSLPKTIRSLPSQPGTRQAIKDWFRSKTSVTVTELADKICCDKGLLLFHLNKNNNFKYTEGSIVDTDRFSACIHFISGYFHTRTRRAEVQLKKKSEKKKKKKSAKNDESKTPKETVIYSNRVISELEPEIRWRGIQLIGHPKQ